MAPIGYSVFGEPGAAVVQTWWAQWWSPSRRVPWLVVIAIQSVG